MDLICLLKKDNSSVGISRFQALSAVLAATVGLGNISGVSIAIHQGGPGVSSLDVGYSSNRCYN